MGTFSLPALIFMSMAKLDFRLVLYFPPYSSLLSVFLHDYLSSSQFSLSLSHLYVNGTTGLQVSVECLCSQFSFIISPLSFPPRLSLLSVVLHLSSSQFSLSLSHLYVYGKTGLQVSVECSPPSLFSHERERERLFIIYTYITVFSLFI